MRYVALFGLFSGLDVDLSYGNWYGFPANYTLATEVDKISGWGLGGLVLAGLVKRPRGLKKQ